MHTWLNNLIKDLKNADPEFVLLIFILVISIIVIDAVRIYLKKQKKEVGLGEKMKLIAIEGSKILPVKEYISTIQGLSGTPDALILEKGFIIPVERKPLSNKIRDRYIAQLFVYMRLIEEFEGISPPYGYLILGKKAKKVKIYNSPKKREWIDKIIKKMHLYLNNKINSLNPTPTKRKCKFCKVKDICQYTAN